MLVLSRLKGESIIIGSSAEIEISLLRIKGNRATIGISAPKSTQVHRKEIYQKIQEDKENVNDE